MNQAIYRVFVKTDDSGIIIASNSSEFLTDFTGWVQIDEGYGDKYHHAQGNYFDGGIYTIDGIPRYKLVDGVPVLRSEEEIAADRDSLPDPPEPSGDLEERVAALEQAQAEIWSAQATAIREGVNSVE